MHTRMTKINVAGLSRLQSATSERKQNIVAYNSSSGVCFEAVKDIKAGEELMALFDKTFKGIRSTLSPRQLKRFKAKVSYIGTPAYDHLVNTTTFLL